MHITCAISGIEFKVEHFPMSLSRGEAHHPIFDAELPRLWKYFPKWQTGELTDTDSYLYFLALLNSTELIQWQCPALRTEKTASIVSSNMEELFYIIGRIVSIKHPSFAVSRIAISKDTRDLSNSRHWIGAWKASYEDFCNGLKDADLRSRLQRKEDVLERLIKNPSLHPSKYAKMLAIWAADCACFPEFDMIDANGNLTTLSEYWQSIIIKCYHAEQIISIPQKDLNELMTHVEENVEMGSIQSFHLFQCLRQGIETLQGFFSIGSPIFTMLTADSDIGDSNLQLLIQSAPTSLPKRTEYASEFAFIKAKMKWNLAVESASAVESGAQS